MVSYSSVLTAISKVRAMATEEPCGREQRSCSTDKAHHLLMCPLMPLPGMVGFPWREEVLGIGNSLSHGEDASLQPVAGGRRSRPAHTAVACETWG